MPDEALPEWTTPLDEEILELLNTELTLTPSVIADNIDRSRGAISRRLNSLEAGGLVEKRGRGKYKITSDGLKMFDGGWKTVELSEEERKEMAKQEYEQRMRIENELGMSESEYLSLVSDELAMLEDENPGGEDLFSEALATVWERHTSDEDS